MKIRTDFVSNSSSCSFIIEDVAAGLKALTELDIMNASGVYDIIMKYVLTTEVFDKCGIKKHESWRDDDEGVVYCRCAPSEILQIPAEVKANMMELELECDDCDQSAVFVLVLLREALDRMGVSVNDTNTEIDLPSFDNNSFVGKLLSCIGKHSK